MFNSVAVGLYLDDLSREAGGALLGLAAIAAAAMLLGLMWLLWRLGCRLTARWTGYRPRRAIDRGVEVDFYRRLERLLARQGWSARRRKRNASSPPPPEYAWPR